MKPEFAEHSFLLQAFYAFIVMNGFKYSCFLLWIFADGANILSGLSFSGRDIEGNPQHERNVSIRCINVETAFTPRDIINNWNTQTVSWLKYYVYVRVEQGEKKNRSVATFLTFITSAFWHGIPLSYYIFFGLLHMLLSSSRKIYVYRDYFRWIPSLVQKIFGFILTHFLMSQLSIIFLLRRSDHILIFLTNSNFIGPIIVVGAYVFSKIIPSIIGDPVTKTSKAVDNQGQRTEEVARSNVSGGSSTHSDESDGDVNKAKMD